MNRAEIIEGLKDVYGTLYAYIPLRKIIDFKIIESCLELLENENALIDKVLEIIDELNDTKALVAKTPLGKCLHDTLANEIVAAVEALKGDET